MITDIRLHALRGRSKKQRFLQKFTRFPSSVTRAGLQQQGLK
jgi:hypothetical protein